MLAKLAPAFNRLKTTIAGSLLKHQCFKHDNNRSEQPGTTGTTQEIQSSTLLARAHLQLKSVVSAQFFRPSGTHFVCVRNMSFSVTVTGTFRENVNNFKRRSQALTQGPASGMLKPRCLLSVT